MSNINTNIQDPNIRKVPGKQGKKYSKSYKKKIKTALKFNKSYKKLKNLLIEFTTKILGVDEKKKIGRPVRRTAIAVLLID